MLAIVVKGVQQNGSKAVPNGPVGPAQNAYCGIFQFPGKVGFHFVCPWLKIVAQFMLLDLC